MMSNINNSAILRDSNVPSSIVSSGNYVNNSTNNYIVDEMNNNESIALRNARLLKNFETKASLRSIEEITPKYRSIFSNFQFFNVVQSKVMPSVLKTDDNLVISAPTGSGKTVIFELAIIRLLSVFEDCNYNGHFKIIYMSPTKALCEERLTDWHSKFAKFGVSCIVVTGDSDNVDYSVLAQYKLIITTPEKWDSLTRRWKNNKKIVEVVKLFLIDEVHLLNEENRGPTLEAVVSRMKTVQESLRYESDHGTSDKLLKSINIRFLAASATIPNVEDIAEWIGRPFKRAEYFKFGEEMRPVKLNRVVLGYNVTNNTVNPFKFELMLNYKLAAVIRQYSEGKPTLIFCSTRKGVEMTCDTLKHELTINFTPEEKRRLVEASAHIGTSKIRETLQHGFGYHHAGLPFEDRRAIEDVFRNGFLPILITTSTLASGVNLPAHLVIIKSTKQYDGPKVGYVDYPETAILQMIGRAGRPQYDKTATAVIMTNIKDKMKYERMVGGQDPVESNLHRHLVEHLNAEVVLHTITDLEVAMRWLYTTFLHVRARKNPSHYNLPRDNPALLDRKLLEMCQIEINRLAKSGMLVIDPSDGINITPTPIGNLMAKYYLAFSTVKLFLEVQGTETLDKLLSLVSKSAEYMEHFLRVSDKKVLNELNKCKTKETVRFPIKGKISSLDMKIYCITQAVFGCLTISNPSLLQESQKIVRVGERISKCLAEYLEMKGTNCFSALLNANILAKCFCTGLWENSRFICKQLKGIGNVLSSALVSAGKFTFDDILESNPRDLERIIRRNAPLGTTIQGEISKLPKYKLELCLYDLTPPFIAHLTITLLNPENVKRDCTVNIHSNMIILVGDSFNNVLLNEKISHLKMVQNPQMTKIINLISDSSDQNIVAHFISENWAGIDAHASFNLSQSDSAGVEIPKSCSENNNPESNSSANTKSVKANKDKNQGNKEQIAQGKKAYNSAHIQQFITTHFKAAKSNSTISTKENKTENKISEKPKQSTLNPSHFNETTNVESKTSCRTRLPILGRGRTPNSKENKKCDAKNVSKSPMGEQKTIFNYFQTSTTPLTAHKINASPSAKVEKVQRDPNTPQIKINISDFALTPRKKITIDHETINQENSNSTSTPPDSVIASISQSKCNNNTNHNITSARTNNVSLVNNCNAESNNRQKNLSWRSPLLLPSPENFFSPKISSSFIQEEDMDKNIYKGRLISPYFRTSVGNLTNVSSQRKSGTPLPTITCNNVKVFPLSDAYFEGRSVSSLTQAQPTLTDLAEYLEQKSTSMVPQQQAEKSPLEASVNSINSIENSSKSSVIYEREFLIPKVQEEQSQQNAEMEADKEEVFEKNLQRFEAAILQTMQQRKQKELNSNPREITKNRTGTEPFFNWEKRQKMGDEYSLNSRSPGQESNTHQNLNTYQRMHNQKDSNQKTQVTAPLNIFEDGNFEFNVEDNWLTSRRRIKQNTYSPDYQIGEIEKFPMEMPKSETTFRGNNFLNVSENKHHLLQNTQDFSSNKSQRVVCDDYQPEELSSNCSSFRRNSYNTSRIGNNHYHQNLQHHSAIPNHKINDFVAPEYANYEYLPQRKDDFLIVNSQNHVSLREYDFNVPRTPAIHHDCEYPPQTNFCLNCERSRAIPQHYSNTSQLSLLRNKYNTTNDSSTFKPAIFSNLPNSSCLKPFNPEFSSQPRQPVSYAPRCASILSQGSVPNYESASFQAPTSKYLSHNHHNIVQYERRPIIQNVSQVANPNFPNTYPAQDYSYLPPAIALRNSTQNFEAPETNVRKFHSSNYVSMPSMNAEHYNWNNLNRCGDYNTGDKQFVMQKFLLSQDAVKNSVNISDDFDSDGSSSFRNY